jgi:integrase
MKRERKQRPNAGTGNPDWQKSPTPNLLRYKPSGMYFARAKVGGKLIRQSLKTDVYSVAVLRLNDLLGRERTRTEGQEKTVRGKMTFGQALALFGEKLKDDPSTKQSSKNYRNLCGERLLKTWPGLKELDVRKIGPRECREWAGRFAKRYSASVYNNTVDTFRMVLKEAVDAGARFGNPADEIEKQSVRPKKLELPSQDQFHRLVDFVGAQGGRFSRHCADLICFLAFGGFRKNEAANVTWADCDFDANLIVVRGDPVTGTKNSEVRRVPMIGEMRELLNRLRARNPPTSSGRVMVIQECQKALDRAAKELQIPRITHHDLRHLFATRCIESGVDIPTVSRWLGHKDGGALAMKVYGHLRDQHSLAMAGKVRFQPAATKEPDTIKVDEMEN